jgi:hypothetical protein
MARTGRPKAEYDIKAFQDLVGLGCTQEEICWYFRDDKGKPANIDTLTRWCKRTFDMTFQEYFKQNGFMAMKIRLRRNQFELSKKSAAMAIWLGKQYLDQKDSIEVESSITDNTREEIGVLIDELNKTRSGTDTDVDTV